LFSMHTVAAEAMDRSMAAARIRIERQHHQG
jgi:hypothetical protein